jgi:hypothetical protein
MQKTRVLWFFRRISHNAILYSNIVPLLVQILLLYADEATITIDLPENREN